MSKMTDDSFLLELKEGATEKGKLNIRLLMNTYYLSIRAGLSDALCVTCHDPIDINQILGSGQKYNLYCSLTCRKEMYDSRKPQFPPTTKHCENCGVPFTVHSAKMLGVRKYCREQCQVEAKNKRKLIKKIDDIQNFNALKNRLERNIASFKQGKGVECLECGQLFIGKSSKKFCSDQPCGQTYRRRQKKNGVR